MADSKRRLGIIGGVALLAAAGASIAGLLVVRAQRAEYVQETLALLGEAKKVHARGEFDESVRLSSAAVKRLQENGGWFETAQSREVQESDALLRKHQGLWNETSQSAALAATDPGEARRRLEAIAARAEAEGERGRPIQARVRPAIEQALAAEREHVRKRVEAVSAAARKHYEGHAFAEFADSVRAIRTAVESLPSASRDGLAAPADLAAFAQVLGEAESAAHESEEDWVKADKVRDLLARVPNPKEAGVHLRQALIERIAALDKETRAPVKTLKIPEASQKKLVEAFTRWGGDVEFIPGVGDLSDGFELQSTRHRYFVRMIGPQPRVLIEADRVRIVFDVDLVNGREGFALESAGAMARGMRATRHERVFAESSWVVVPDAPGPCAVQTEGDRAWIYLEGRVYDGDVKGQDPDTNSKVGTFLSRARLLEATVRNSDGVPEALRGPVVALLRAAHTPAAPHDYLDGQFCREAIHGGYLEGHLPKIDESVVDRLKGYRDSYDEILRWRARMTGSNKEGGRVESTSNLEGDGLWRLFDPAGPATTFALSPRDPMGTRLVVHTTFEGKHDLWPEAAEPIRVLMFHPAAGEIARWEAATGKLTFDAERWARALRTDEPQGISDHFGKAEWRVPPHVVRVDSRGRPQALILPNGTLRAAPFAPGPARRDAQEKFLDDCARLLRTPGELHLFYRYFVQYVLDSPVTTAVTLIGSSRHTGEVHQDAYQTLDRWVAGRLLADCDDLAEFYQTVLKRQGRLAYVLGVPGHATCGLIEKEGDEWVFFCVDTGPPRQLRDKDLDMVLERLLLTYDDEGDMSFDPRSVRFMFRFAGEQTRSDYYLDSRMFRDREYAEIMIRVQEFWHFSFYALGIETMGKMLETDKMPANCAEIAGLFMRVGQYEHAIRWTETGVAGLDPKDPLSRLNESMRKALCLRELKRTGDAVQVLKASAAELAAIQRDKPDESHRYRRLRFEIATSLAESGDPWSGWELVAVDVRELLFEQALAEALGAEVTNIYSKMRRAQREGGILTDAQNQEVQNLEKILEEFFEGGLFKADDSFNTLIRKYGVLAEFYAAKSGPEAATAELLKPEVPQGRRRHEARKGAAPDLDWRWMRLSPFAYSHAAGDFLDEKYKGADGPKQAAAIIRAMEAALPEIRKQGSLGPVEFMVLDLKLVRGCLEMDEAAIREVFDEMKRQAWGQLYETLAGTLGRTARHMKPEDFTRVFNLFCDSKVPRRHYYGVVYPAYQSGALEPAVAASRICIERFPNDADMRREHELLLKLATPK